VPRNPKRIQVESESDFNGRASLITFQFHSLVVSLSERKQERVFMSCMTGNLFGKLISGGDISTKDTYLSQKID